MIKLDTDNRNKLYKFTKCGNYVVNGFKKKTTRKLEIKTKTHQIKIMECSKNSAHGEMYSYKHLFKKRGKKNTQISNPTFYLKTM